MDPDLFRVLLILADAAGLETTNHFPRRKTIKEILCKGVTFSGLYSVAQVFSAWMSPRSFHGSQFHIILKFLWVQFALCLNKCFISRFALAFLAMASWSISMKQTSDALNREIPPIAFS